MPNADTFDIPPIGDLVKRYLRESKVSIDPFARNKRWATYTNDLNPNTAAEWHLDVLDFLKMLIARGVCADLIIFDPPYSLQQTKEVYAGVGRDFTMHDAQNVGRWTEERDLMYELLAAGGVVLTFGWNTIGMGKQHDCEIEEILLVAHGSAHNDTICMAERKIAHQQAMPLFAADDVGWCAACQRTHAAGKHETARAEDETT